MESEEYQDNRSMSKTETIKLLNDTIERLKTIVSKIESKTTEDLPDLASVRTLAKTTANLAIVVENPQSLESISQAATPSPSTPSGVAAPQSVRKPPTNNRRTIALLSGMVVLIVVGFWLWLSPPPLKFLTRQSPQPEIAAPVAEIPETNATKSPEIAENPVIPPAEIAPPEAENPNPPSEPEIIEKTIPQELTAPGDEVNLPLKTVELPLQLTPEQSLIAAIQERIATITQNYSEAKILSVRADFPASKLIITVSNDWYQLSDSRQSKLADDILERARKLDFSKLELKDADDNLIARSPVVGDRAIIYSKRREINEE
ncbi:hypothetical protein [Myxosarcina sp. GI1(2024)]